MTGTEKAVFRGHTPSDRRLFFTFALDGKSLFSAMDGKVVHWRSVMDNQEWQLPGINGTIAVAPDGRHLAVPSSTGAVYILRVAAPPTQ